MTSLLSLHDSYIWYFLCLISMFLLVESLHMSISALKAKHGRGRIALILSNLILSLVIFIILMDCGQYFRIVEPYADYNGLQYAVYSLPWLVIAGMEFAAAMIWALTEIEKRQYRSSHLTMNAIRSSIDHLPEGIAIGDMKGTVLLSNLKMVELYRKLTGDVLSDSKHFPDRIKKMAYATEPQLIVADTEGRLWLFEIDTIRLDEEEFQQIIARDVTQQYRIIDELKDKNDRLKDIQKRMKAVSDMSADMFVAEERAKARAALHSQLGQVLLMGRYYLKNRNVADPEQVYAITQQMNRILLGEAEEDKKAVTDPLTEAVTMAGGIGVSVHMNEDIPQDMHIRELLSEAIIECAANTVKHAGGDCVTVTCHPERSEGSSSMAFTITITNNGKPPKGTVAESGGLLALRKKVEAMSGEMQTESAPSFRLTIRISAENGTNG